jgi:predicted anti-sigma-YlaC factor YlaD
MDWRRWELKCRKVRKNLSAFLDNELNTDDHKQVELHILECTECREEFGKLKHTINLVSRIERPEVPSYLWETTREKLTIPERIRFRIPKWSFIPVGAVAFTFLMYILVSQSFFIKQENTQIPVAVYIQEHNSVYSEQASLLDSLSEQTYAKVSLTSEKSESNAPSSELDIFMEVHYGGI